MANFIQTDIKKRNLVCKHEVQRLNYKFVIKNLSLTQNLRLSSINKLNFLNKNSSLVRVKNRCFLTGRGRSVYTLFKLSRLKFRELASQGKLTGVHKASW